MDLGLPFRLYTFDDITMKSSGFKGYPIFLIIPCFWKIEIIHNIQTLQAA